MFMTNKCDLISILFSNKTASSLTFGISVVKERLDLTGRTTLRILMVLYTLSTLPMIRDWVSAVKSFHLFSRRSTLPMSQPSCLPTSRIYNSLLMPRKLRIPWNWMKSRIALGIFRLAQLWLKKVKLLFLISKRAVSLILKRFLNW